MPGAEASGGDFFFAYAKKKNNTGEVVKLIKNKDHLSIKGLKQIINIKASMNLGLSDMLKLEFNGFVPVCRPTINTKFIPDANWISGFVSGEGTFDALITQSTNKIGSRVQLRFRIVQHERDIKLMENIVKYLPLPRVFIIIFSFPFARS